MSAVDAPPGMDFAGLAAGEFRARTRARRLARIVFVYVVVVAGISFVLAARHPFRAGAEVALVLPLMSMAIAGLGLAVRRARLQVDPTGVRWGWASLGFRMGPSRLQAIRVYADAVAFEPKRGSMWYVAGRDWGEFDRFAAALERAGLPFEAHGRKAPLRSRLQSYGAVLDVLMIGAALLATFLLLLATG